MILWNQRSDNTTCTVQIKGQKKKTKFQEMIYKTTTQKIKDWATWTQQKKQEHEPNKKQGWTWNRRGDTDRWHEHDHLIWKSCWTSVYINKITCNNINKTWTPYKTNGKDEPNIIFYEEIVVLVHQL